MVVFLRPPQYKASTVTSRVDLTGKPEVGKYIKRAIDGDQPDVGVFLTHFIVDSCWREVVMAGSDCV